MKWQKKLNRKELKHIKETTNACRLWEIRVNIANQRKDNFPCFECESIAQKLNLKIKE